MGQPARPSFNQHLFLYETQIALILQFSPFSLAYLLIVSSIDRYNWCDWPSKGPSSCHWLFSGYVTRSRMSSWQSRTILYFQIWSLGEEVIWDRIHHTERIVFMDTGLPFSYLSSLPVDSLLHSANQIEVSTFSHVPLSAFLYPILNCSRAQALFIGGCMTLWTLGPPSFCDDGRRIRRHGVYHILLPRTFNSLSVPGMFIDLST